jgi:hypothetical protein
MAYEGRTSILRADEWDRMGRPPITPPQAVFGVTDVKLRTIQGEPEPVFEASYTRWFPVPPEEPSAGSRADGRGAGRAAGANPGAAGSPGGPGTPYGPTVSSLEVRERYFLRQHRGYWVIYRIEPV